MLNKLRSLGTALAVVSLCLGLTAGAALAQEPPATPAADAAHADDAHEPVGHDAPGAVIEEGHAADAAHDADAHGADEAHGEEHHESIWTTIARVANFALLAGGLFYFLREPISQHLESRGTQIRNDLETAARVKAEAAARLAEIEQRLARLPEELELVKQRGAEEVAAEEARIARQAEVERARLVAQAQREIEQQLRTARHELRQHAAALAIGVAEQRLRTTLTDAEQQRLADDFTRQIGGAR